MYHVRMFLFLNNPWKSWKPIKSPFSHPIFGHIARLKYQQKTMGGAHGWVGNTLCVGYLSASDRFLWSKMVERYFFIHYSNFLTRFHFLNDVGLQKKIIQVTNGININTNGIINTVSIILLIPMVSIPILLIKGLTILIHINIVRESFFYYGTFFI